MNKILELYPEYTTVYGPYMRKDGRKHIILYNSSNGNRKTISLPKALMEISLQRKLAENETVDHIDRDKTNDDLINLQVLTQSAHSSLDALRRKVILGICPICGKEFELSRDQLTRRSDKCAGPFCSRSCSGKYSRNLQLGRTPTLGRSVTTEDIQYYRPDK